MLEEIVWGDIMAFVPVKFPDSDAGCFLRLLDEEVRYGSEKED